MQKWQVGVAAFLLTFLYPSTAWTVEVRDLSIEFKHFDASGQFAELPGEKVKDGLALNFSLGVLGPLYWDNQVHALTTDAQYRLVGWQFEVGVAVFPCLDVFYFHHSQHVLDGHHPLLSFMVEDAVGFRWILAGPLRRADRSPAFFGTE